MKECIKCKTSYPLDLFGTYKNRKGNIAHVNTCKGCISEYKKEHYKANKQKYLDKAKKQREENVEYLREWHKEYRSKNKERLAAQRKARMTTDHSKKLQSLRYKRYRDNLENKEKYDARVAVRLALDKGKLIKPNKCKRCGSVGYVEAHHHDYSKPLEVQWLCKKCHENIHHLNGGYTSIWVTANKPIGKGV